MIKQQLSLLHIEDDSLWQVTLAQAFRALPSVASVTSVATGLAGLARVQSDRPDLVVLDAVLPDCDGLGLIAQIAESSPHTRVLLLSARRDEFILFSATQPHVAGLLCKSEGVFAQLAVAIQSVAAGEKYFSLEVRETLRRFRGDPKAFYKLLSPRELAVLARVAHGDSDAGIAARLELSEHTIRSHRQHIMQKLDLPNAARLIHWAITHGFGSNRRPHAWRADEDE